VVSSPLLERNAVTTASKTASYSWLLVPLLLLAFWLGARGLNADPIWFDEWWTIYNAGGAHYGPLSPAGIWNRIAAEDPWQAPGYYILLSLWAGLSGWQPPALRALSLFFGVLALALTYRAGRDILSPRIGLYAAALVGTGAFYVHYLSEMRVYTLFALLLALTIWTYWRIATSEPKGWMWAGLFAGAVGLLYSQYFAAMPLIAIGLYHLLFAPRTRRWWQVTGVLALAGLTFVPWVGALLAGLDQASEAHFAHKTAISIGDTFERIAYLFGNGSAVLTAAVVALAVRPRQRGAWPVWFWLLAALALILLVNLLVQIMTPARMRYLYGLWPLLGLLAAVGIDRLRRWGEWLPPLVVAAWLVIGVWTSLDPNFIPASGLDGAGPQWHTFPWHRARDVFVEHTQPGDAVIVNVPDGIGRVPLPEHQIPEFYLHGSGVRVGVIGSQSTAQQDEAAVEAAVEYASQSPRVWVAYEPERRNIVLPDFESALSERYGLCEVGVAQSTFRFDLYARSPVCCLPDGSPPLMRFGDGIALVGQEMLPITEADLLPVTLSWTIADSVPPYTYSVALHVEDEAGNLVAQSDYGLPVSSTACQESTVMVHNLPPGEYKVLVIVYAWASGERLVGEDAATGERGDRLLLGTFDIAS
jgi:hypothetical protein